MPPCLASEDSKKEGSEWSNIDIEPTLQEIFDESTSKEGDVVLQQPTALDLAAKNILLYGHCRCFPDCDWRQPTLDYC